MPFPDRLLSPGEQVVLDVRPSALTVVLPAVYGVAALVCAGLLAFIVPGELGLNGVPRLAARGVAAAGALAILLFGVLPGVARWRSTRMVLTTQRVLLRSGVLSRRARDIPLERVNDVTCAQSLPDRLLGIGDLLIESAGRDGQERVARLRRPAALQLAIYQQMEDVSAVRAAPFVHPDANAGVLEQLERLAVLRDRGVVSPDEFEVKKQELLRRL